MGFVLKSAVKHFNQAQATITIAVSSSNKVKAEELKEEIESLVHKCPFNFRGTP